MKNAIVIGAGIGGLAAALRLKIKGYEVLVIEKEQSAGGKMNTFSESGYRFDTGPSLFTLPHLLDELFALFGKAAKHYYEIVALDTTCNYYFPGGKQLRAWSDHERFVQEAVKSGVERETIENYLEKQSFLYEYSSDFFLFNSIHKISTYTGEAGRKSLKVLPKLDAMTTMHKRNESYFGESILTQLFDRYATYNGSDPYRAPATLNMIAHLEHNTGAFFPKNGMYGIVNALLKLAQEEGIKIQTNEAVQSIVGNDVMVTEVITDKDRYKANLVVNDTDITYFYKNIMPNRKQLKRLLNKERSSSALIFYWGMNLSSDLDVHNILFAGDYKKEFEGLFRTKQFADDLSVYIFISKKVVEDDAPKGKENWFVMVNAPEHKGQNWEDETARARNIIVRKIEQMLNIKVENYLEVERVMTPADIERKTASVGGSLYGHSSNSPFAAFLRHPNFSRKYKNLYFVGGSVHPGGGIPLCLASAKIVDQLIEEA